MTQPDNRLATVLSTVSGSTCTVSIDGITTTIEVLRGVTVAVDDVVLIHRVGPKWISSGRLYAAAPAPPPDPGPEPTPPPPKPVVTTGQLVIPPVETRSYRTSFGWRDDNTDVYHGQYGGWGNHTGCAFYGSKPRSLAGATVTSASIKVQRPANTGGVWSAQPTTLWLLSQSSRPGGAPTRNESTSGPNIAAGRTVSSFAIPDSWAQAMVDGTRGGLGLYEADGTPYVIFSGRSRWSAAFTLTINWRRAT